MLAAEPSLSGLAPSGETRILLGEAIGLGFNFVNTSATDTGFSPFLEVALDTSGPDGATSFPLDGISAPTLTSTGLQRTPIGSVTLTSGQTTWTNPYTGTTRPVPAGFGANDTIYVYSLPFGSFTPSQTTSISFAASTSNLADIGTPMRISVVPGFRDIDAVGPFTPLFGSVFHTDVTPELYRLSKTNSAVEGETATGPNYVQRYRIEVDLPAGQAFSNVRIFDTLASSMQILGRNATSVAGNPNMAAYLLGSGSPGANVFDASRLTGTAPSTSPGGMLNYDFGNMTGVGGADAAFEFNFYIPRDHANPPGGQVLPQTATSGTDSNVAVNTANSQANWNPLDPRDPQNQAVFAPGSGQSVTASLEQQSIAVQKSVAAIDPTTGAAAASIVPGRTLLRYTISFQVSDYYAFDDVVLRDVMSDGQVGVLDLAGANPHDDTYFSTFDPTLVGVRNPTLSTSATNNELILAFGTHDDIPQRRGSQISILVTFVISNDPFVNDLYLTNQLRIEEASTNAGDTTAERIRQIELVRPFVSVQKGAVAANGLGLTSGNIAFAPATNATGRLTVGGNALSASNSINSAAQAAAIGGLNISSANAPVDAGDTVRYALVVQNTGEGDAFDIRVTDQVQPGYVIPASFSGLNFRGFRGDGTTLVLGADYTLESYNSTTGAFEIQLTDNYTGGNLGGAAEDARSGALSRGATRTAPITNGSNTVLFLYDLQLSGSVAPNSSITNTATVTRYSNQEAGPDVTDPAVLPGVSDPITTANTTTVSPAIAKALTSTDLTTIGNTATQATIGEMATYTVTLTVPEGVTPNARISDSLQDGLAFTRLISVTPSNPSALTFTNSFGTLPGTQPANVTVANGNLATDTMAFDVLLNDVLPSVIQSPSIVSATSTGGVLINGTAGTVAIGDLQLAGSTLTFNRNIDMPRNSSITIVVEGQLQGGLGAPIDNFVDVTWTSLDGAVSDRSIHNAASDERAGAGGVDDYTSRGQATIDSPPLVRKRIMASSESHTVQPQVAVGEIVRYRLVSTLPEGTSRHVILQDSLPAGLRFLNDGTARYAFISTSGSGITSLGITDIAGLGTAGGRGGSELDIGALLSSDVTGLFNDSNISPTVLGAGTGDAPLYNSAQSVSFRFGDLANSDNDPDNEYVVVEFNALVANQTENQAGFGLNNAFTVLADANLDGVPGYLSVAIDDNGNGVRDLGENTVAAIDADNNATTAPNTLAFSNVASLAVGEPALSIDKQAIATTGAIVTYRVTVTNASGANIAQAFNTRVVDTLDGVNLSLRSGSVSAVAFTGGANGASDNSSGNTLDVAITAMPPGATATFTYQANVLTTPAGTTTVDNAARVTYTSLPGTAGTGDNWTGVAATSSTVPGAAGSASGERTGADGAGQPNDYAASDVERLGSLGDRVWVDLNNNGAQDSGEPGIVAAPLSVRWAGRNGIFDDADDSLISTATGADGVYLVTGLPIDTAGVYRVVVDTAAAVFVN